MASCPHCGDPDAYVGMREVECPNSACPNFKAPPAASEESSDELALEWLEADEDGEIDVSDIGDDDDLFLP